MLLKDIIDEYNVAKIALAEKIKGQLAPAMRAAMLKDGRTVVNWNQYTPYFNDGDPCVFTVETYAMEDGYDYNEAGEEINVPTATNCANLINSIPEEVLLNLFGNGVKVTATLTDNSVNFTTEEYDHD